MKNIQLLAEKDLEYFRKMEEEGRAVILDIPEEQLLQLDFSDWMKKERNMIRGSEVVQWLMQNQFEIGQFVHEPQNIEEAAVKVKGKENKDFATICREVSK